jgi:hypothetical protein
MNHEVDRANKELFELISNNPELVPMQIALSKAMDNVSENNRLAVLTTFLQVNLSDLKYELFRLKELLGDKK